MNFIGDVHGKWKEYFKLIEGLDCSIQLGDFGMGFGPSPKPWSLKHKFIRGNHDSPQECKLHPNYLGDWGYESVFYVSGAFSIDYQWRQSIMAMGEKTCWWEDEELHLGEFNKVMKLYKKIKPEIVISHDCPAVIRDKIVGGNSERIFKNRTSDKLLEDMFREHQPKLWVFGHYHSSQTIAEGTKFVLLDELEVFRV